MATFYDYENRTALDPYTGAGAPNAVGQVFAKTDTTFQTPLTVVLMGSGLQATDMQTDQYSQLPGFQVEDHLQVVFKSGDFTKVLNTTTPLVGPQGPAVSEAVDNGDNTVTFLLEDGTPAATVALPASDIPGPPGDKGDKGDTGLPGPDAIPADEAVATYATTPGTATATALNATIADQTGPIVEGHVVTALAADNTPALAAREAVDAALLTKLVANRTIITRGDSQTAGAKGNGVSYPVELSKLVPGIPVISRGFPGEKTLDIAKRQGSVPLMVTVTGGSLPSTTGAIPVTVNATIYIGPDAGNGVPDGLGLFGSINGVRGELRGNPTSGFNFYRTSAGSAIPVPAPVPWVDEFETRHRDANQIIMTGRNNMNIGYDDVVPYSRKIADYQTAGDHLVMSILTRVDETRGTAGYDKVVAKNSQLAAEFGDHYFDLRSWLITNGLTSVGLTPTAADTDAINADTIPPALMDADLLHPNANGYKAMAFGVSEAIVARGWTGIVPLPPAPSAGVDDYDYRFIANRSTLDADAALAEWSNEISWGADLVQATTAKQPVLRRTAGDAWVDFDGVDDMLKLPSFAPTGGVTVAILARVQSTAFSTLVNLTNSGGIDMQMVSQPQAGSAKFDIRANPTTRLALADTTKNPGDGAWHLMVGVFNGTSSIAAFDTVATAGAIGAGLANRLSFGDTNMSTQGGVPPNYDVAEIIVWNRPLTSSEITGTLYPALKANHPTLLV